MDEGSVDGGEIVAAVHGFEQLLAHAHSAPVPPGADETAEQLLPAWLGRHVHLERDLVRGILLPGAAAALRAGAIGPEFLPQRLEEGDARAGRQLAVPIEDSRASATRRLLRAPTAAPRTADRSAGAAPRSAAIAP